MEMANKQAARLRLLNSVSTQLQRLLESEDFHQSIVDVIAKHLPYYAIQFWCATDNAGAKLMAQVGAYEELVPLGKILKSSEAGITGYVIRTKKTYISNDVTQDPNFTSLSLPVKTQSQICVPVMRDDHSVLATLNIESELKGTFEEEDIITLEAIASQVSVAMNNRELFNNVKKFNQSLKGTVVEKTEELKAAQERIQEQQKLLRQENRSVFTLDARDKETNEFIGKSPAILSIIAMVDKIAPTTATVLIQGESGTGKELIARRLHYRSERSKMPYVTVNCGALQESLLESELFGHEKGAFTGAVGQKIGLVETANGGTLFLDEIGELSLGIQAKLLRFLQEGEFYRIGGKKPLRVDVRIVSATNRDLEQEVKENRFREDLFYRLNTITLRMPPLRKRKEDIPSLVEFFLKHSRFGDSSGGIKKIDPRVFETMQNYEWPGNIRELQNVVERMRILAENQELRIDDVPFNIRTHAVGMNRPTPEEFQVTMPLEEIEKKHILHVLAYHHGNKTRAAHSLGITIKTLYNKLHRYGMIATEQFEQPSIDSSQSSG